MTHSRSRTYVVVGLSLALLSTGSTRMIQEAQDASSSRTEAVTVARASGPDAADLFKRQCVACHGKKGEGDGPAAIALQPRPANLTDPERIGPLSNEELVAVITEGKGSMPSFGSLLQPGEINALVRYIRQLSGTESGAQAGD